MTDEHKVKVSRLKSLKTLYEEKGDRDAQEIFFTQVAFEILQMRIEAGDKEAANILLRKLANDLILGETAPLQVLQIAEILNSAISQNLSHKLLSKPRGGQRPRNYAKCVEIYLAVIEAKEKYQLPLKDGTKFKGHADETDAIGLVAKHREANKQKPWIYDTVRNYYIKGRQIYLESENRTLEAFARLESLFLQDETKDSETNLTLTGTNPPD